jgi:hypothetical protein
VRLKLRPFGPSGGLLEEIGRQMVVPGAIKPRVGFSADLIFTAQGKSVQKIVKVYSLDLVFNPARGGSFVRAISPTQGTQPTQLNLMEAKMNEEVIESTTPQEVIPSPMEDELDKARQLRQQMCNTLLDSSLTAAHLPNPVSERVRGRFKDRLFEAQELNTAIDDARQMVSELTAASVVRGPSSIHSMFTATDQVSAAIHDLLGAERPAELKAVQPHRLSGIREMYTLMTGDTDFAGGYDPRRAQFAATADLPGILKNALNKLIVMQWEQLGRAGYRWWEAVVDVEHFNSLQPITGVLVGEVSVLPTVNEGAAYTELPLSDSAETSNWTKYGGYIGLTLEMFERDETHKLVQYPRKLASAALRRVSSLVASVFTASSGTGPAMTDSYHVFDASHHANLGTAALDGTAWEAACKAIYGQDMKIASGGMAPKMALDAKYCLVPRELRLAAMQILYPSFAHESNIFSENMQRGEMGDVITVPEFTDANDWAAAADPRLAPGIIIAERFGLMPEIFIADNPLNGALFTNDELRMKVRHWLSVFVADYRPLYKANVA